MTALEAGVTIAWLATQTGVNYLTLRRHYWRWMPSDAGRELDRFTTLDTALFAPLRPRLLPVTSPTGHNGEKSWRFLQLPSARGEPQPVPEPELLVRDGWEIDAREYKGRDVFGAVAADWRGLVKTPGA